MKKGDAKIMALQRVIIALHNLTLIQVNDIPCKIYEVE